ncbi:MAG: DNA polymerase I [Candidatus Hydrogenedentes bacterium]|nr:DNA polymerase I [Candidatus Hydrogenedentota bacterium]
MVEDDLFSYQINKKEKKIYLFDGMGFLFRSFYAIQAPLRDKDNNPTNAIYGFIRTLLKVIREHNPEYLVVALDAPGKTFREEIFSEYKANRPEPPKEFVQQIPRALDLVKSLNIPVIFKEGYEADDVIATISKKAISEGFEVIIVSGDKDLLQLLDKNVKMFDAFREDKGKWYAVENVIERFGTDPTHVPDALALIGDTADNVPGVKGIGDKTAKKLMEEYRSLENLYNNLDKLPPKLKKSLEEAKQQVFNCRDLLTVRTDVPIDFNLEHFRRKPYENQVLLKQLQELSFLSLIRELNLKSQDDEKSPQNLESSFSVIKLREDMDSLTTQIKNLKRFSFDLHIVNSDILLPELSGISISLGKGQNYYIPLSNSDIKSKASSEETHKFENIKLLLESEEIKKFGFNLKEVIKFLVEYGVNLAGIGFDVMVASYITDPNFTKNRLEDIAGRFINDLRLIEFEKDSTVPFEKVYSTRAEVIYLLSEELERKLKEISVDALYYEIEQPLIPVLADMELTGIKINPQVFAKLKTEIDSRLSYLESEIYRIAGEEFNISSPKQLQVILFEKLGLKPIRKTKTGSSTDMEVLEELALEHPLPGLIIEYRTLQKLLNTYIEALPKLVNPRTGRVHTTFNQTVVATGRLSSTDPNLQNIPIRTEYGKRIREGFIATDKDWVLISADYSQIELRVLAHFSEDPALCEAFNKDLDIHRETASRIFDIPLDRVTDDQRRQAKAINFGVIYGMTPYGLSKTAGISTSDANKFIEQYFQRFPKVKEWIDRIVQNAREKGYTTTLFNRRRYIPQLNSSNQNERKSGERMAINTPVQGSAADIIKKAMIEVHKYLKETGARLLLQVHDELLIEAPIKKANKIGDKVKEIMESVVQLKVPLKVDIGMGSNWAEAH